ncbi:MAG: DUF4911 domain-containing protein [Myxococcota bacterium]|nr:DUF4911 domain-containing protein [Myxococcota bacterium]
MKACSEATRVAAVGHFPRLLCRDKPNVKTVLRSVQVEVADIAYLRFLLEAHDGLAVPTTRQGTSDIIDFVIAPDFEEEFDELLAALSSEMKLIPVTSPRVSPLGEED